jgi:hypothetical protein
MAEVITLDRTRRLVVLDRLTSVAPLGLRFHDAANGTVVGDGLSVSAYPFGQPDVVRALTPNRRGVFILHHAPGLRTVENGTGDDDYWKNLPPKKDFVIEVRDEQDRFLPFQFVVALPHKGIYEWHDPLGSPLSPLATTSSIPLYSSPARTVPAGMAVVRADLWDPTRGANGAEAAGAVLELFENDRFVGRGIADQKGHVAVMFPYPSPKRFAQSSPPGSPLGSPLGSPPRVAGPALTDQVWTFRVRALYAIQSPPQTVSSAALPDLHAVLSQTEAAIWDDEARTSQLSEVAVQYGQPLILRSRPLSSPPFKGGSILFITPAV